MYLVVNRLESPLSCRTRPEYKYCKFDTRIRGLAKDRLLGGRDALEEGILNQEPFFYFFVKYNIMLPYCLFILPTSEYICGWYGDTPDIINAITA